MSQWTKRGYTKVVLAKRHGLLVPQPCERCGNPKVHAHHEDYSKPLEVTWLCHKHHFMRHKEMGWQRKKYKTKYNFDLSALTPAGLILDVANTTAATGTVYLRAKAIGLKVRVRKVSDTQLYIFPRPPRRTEKQRKQDQPNNMPRAKENCVIAISISKSLVAQIDEQARADKRTRSNWIAVRMEELILASDNDKEPNPSGFESGLATHNESV
jgi:hypothetical protein